MSDAVATRQAEAARVWKLLFDLFMRTRGARDAVLVRHALTPNDAKALSALDPEEGKPMGLLARLWGTDAPNATWVVDRLERKGLAQRRPARGDRRVKHVVLTAQGVRTRAALLRGFYRPPEELLTLDAADLTTLGDILERLERRPQAGTVRQRSGRAARR